MLEMATARSRAEWDTASVLWAQIRNVQCTEESQAVHPFDVHPFHRSPSKGMRMTKENLHVLKKVFGKRESDRNVG